MSHIPPTCTELETVSLTAQLTKETQKWDRHSTAGSLGARTVGFIATPLTSLIDTLVHSFLFLGKASTGLLVSFYNHCIAKPINPKYMASSKDLEFSSAIVHLARIVDNVVRAAILPVLMLCSPERGYLLSQESSGEVMQSLRNRLTENQVKILLLEHKIKHLDSELKEEKKQKVKFQGEYGPTVSHLKKELDKVELQKVELEDKNSELKAEMSCLDEREKTLNEKVIPELKAKISNKEQQLKDALAGKITDLTLLEEKDQLIAELKQALKKLGVTEHARKEAVKALDEKAEQTEALEKEIEGIQKEKASWEEALTEAKEEITAKQRKIENFLEVKEAAQADAQKHKEEIQTASDRIAALESTIKERELAAEELKASMEKKDQLIAKKKEELEASLQCYKELEKLPFKIEKLQDEIKGLKANEAKADAEMAAKQQEMEELMDQVEAVKGEFDKMSKQLADLKLEKQEWGVLEACLKKEIQSLLNVSKHESPTDAEPPAQSLHEPLASSSSSVESSFATEESSDSEKEETEK